MLAYCEILLEKLFVLFLELLWKFEIILKFKKNTVCFTRKKFESEVDTKLC